MKILVWMFKTGLWLLCIVVIYKFFLMMFKLPLFAVIASVVVVLISEFVRRELKPPDKEKK